MFGNLEGGSIPLSGVLPRRFSSCFGRRTCGFTALFIVIWTSKKLILITVAEKSLELRMYLLFVENELHSAFPKY